MRDTAGALATFGDMMPLVGQQMPDSEEFMQNLRDRSLEAYEQLDPETVSQNAVRLNGKNGILAEDF